MEEKTLIIPGTVQRNPFTLAPLVVVASVLAYSPSHNRVSDNLLMENQPSTGSNRSWIENALPQSPLSMEQDLYIQAIQKTKNLGTQTQETITARFDRDSLLKIKDVLSLTGTQLAKTMRVSRTALYQWLDERTSMRPKHRQRLQVLRKLADQWLEKAGTSISHCHWISEDQRAQLVEILTSQTKNNLEHSKHFLEKLAIQKPESVKKHRSILDIMKEKNWQQLPKHIRQAQWNSRRSSARISFEPS